MRINVYSQELITDDDSLHEISGDLGAEEGACVAELVAPTESDTGAVYSAVRLYLHSSPRLHHPPGDDDRSAITFWLPKSSERREFLATSFENLAHLVRQAPPETGLD